MLHKEVKVKYSSKPDKRREAGLTEIEKEKKSISPIIIKHLHLPPWVMFWKQRSGDLVYHKDPTWFIIKVRYVKQLNHIMYSIIYQLYYEHVVSRALSREGGSCNCFIILGDMIFFFFSTFLKPTSVFVLGLELNFTFTSMCNIIIRLV